MTRGSERDYRFHCRAMLCRPSSAVVTVRGLLVVAALSLIVATPVADAAISPVHRRHDKRARSGPEKMAADKTTPGDGDGGDYDEADEYDEDNGDYQKPPPSTPADTGDDDLTGKYQDRLRR